MEIDGFVALHERLSLTFGGHRFEGRDTAEVPLADVPADRAYLGLRQHRKRWGWRLRWERRAAKDDPGSGEKTIGQADLVSAAVDYELRTGLTLVVSVRNALDESYFNAADRRVPLAVGRSASILFRWS